LRHYDILNYQTDLCKTDLFKAYDSALMAVSFVFLLIPSLKTDF